jgi:hypothetical protein
MRSLTRGLLADGRRRNGSLLLSIDMTVRDSQLVIATAGTAERPALVTHPDFHGAGGSMQGRVAIIRPCRYPMPCWAQFNR